MSSPVAISEPHFRVLPRALPRAFPLVLPWPLLAAIPVFAIPLILFARLILFHFYVRGSFLLDSGLLASLMWHSAPNLPLPASLGGLSYFAFHVAPVLLAISAVSRVLPLSMAELFAAVTGLSHALLALAMFWLLVQGHGMRRGAPLALAALASCAFAFNGLALSIARYPHFEIFGAACLLLFLVALVLKRRAIATACLLLALTTREDIGLHALGFLTLWLALNWYRGERGPQSRWIAGFALVALAWSATAVLLQHRAFPDASAFVRVYLGNPPLAHVDAKLVTTRLFGWLMLHAAILLPAAATSIWAVRARDPFIALGYLACLPWALLNLLAVSDMAGWMVGYYAYPFLIAIAWPLLAGVVSGVRADLGPPSWHGYGPALIVLSLVALSLLPLGHDYDPGRITVPDAFLHAPPAEQRAATDRAIVEIAAARPSLGRIVVDNSVAALLPFAFARTEVAGWEDAPADTAVFLSDGFDAIKMRDFPGLPNHFAIPGTTIRLRTNRPEQTIRATGLLD
jgi:hypothetical protein